MSDASTPRKPDQTQDATPSMDLERDAAPTASEVEGGARVAEAGHGYVGRTMDDALKSNPRVEDGDEAVDRTPSTARDD